METIKVNDEQKEFMTDLLLEYKIYQHRFDNEPDEKIKAISQRLAVLPFETWYILKMNSIL